MTRKSITTSHTAITCDICGRTLLRGENADVFLAGGSRRMVCELCVARATHEGWIREGLDMAAGSRRSGDRRRRSLLSRLRPRRETAQDALRPGGGEALLEHDGAPQAPPQPPAEPVFEPPRERRHVHAVPTNAELKMQRALVLFNASEHPRTVGGVARSLGQPIVAVRPSLTEGSVVGIIVAWELSWYRYEVDLGDEAAGVRLIAKGYELEELEPEDQTANATADEHGELALAR